MAADPITAGLDLVSSLTTQVAGPLIAQAVAQKYEKQYTDDLTDIQAAVTAAIAPGGSGAQLDALSERLCVAGGVPAPGDVGPFIPVPVGRLVALLTLAAGKRRSDAYNAEFLHKATA